MFRFPVGCGRHVLVAAVSVAALVVGGRSFGQCNCGEEVEETLSAKLAKILPPEKAAVDNSPVFDREVTQASWLNGEPGSFLWLPPVAKQSPYYASLIGGGGYFDSSKTRSTGLIGARVSVPIGNNFGATAMAALNMYSGGTQYWTTLGLFRKGRYFGDGVDRFGGHVRFNQWTDTSLGSPYMVSGDYLAYYTLLPGVRGGVRYIDPIAGKAKNAVVPGGPAGSIRNVEVVEAILKFGSNRKNVQAAIGYSNPFNSVTIDLSTAQPLTERISAVGNAGYFEHVGLWYGFWGLQVDLSPRRSSTTLALRSRPGDVIRGDGLLNSSAESSGWEDDEADDVDGGDIFEGQMISEMNRELALQALNAIAAKGGKCHCQAGDSPELDGNGNVVKCFHIGGPNNGDEYAPICH